VERGIKGEFVAWRLRASAAVLPSAGRACNINVLGGLPYKLRMKCILFWTLGTQGQDVQNPAPSMNVVCLCCEWYLHFVVVA